MTLNNWFVQEPAGEPAGWDGHTNTVQGQAQWAALTGGRDDSVAPCCGSEFMITSEELETCRNSLILVCSTLLTAQSPWFVSWLNDYWYHSCFWFFSWLIDYWEHYRPDLSVDWLITDIRVVLVCKWIDWFLIALLHWFFIWLIDYCRLVCQLIDYW